MSVVTCTKCGSINEPHTNYCISCGTELKKPATSNNEIINTPRMADPAATFLIKRKRGLRSMFTFTSRDGHVSLQGSAPKMSGGLLIILIFVVTPAFMFVLFTVLNTVENADFLYALAPLVVFVLIFYAVFKSRKVNLAFQDPHGNAVGTIKSNYTRTKYSIINTKFDQMATLQFSKSGQGEEGTLTTSTSTYIVKDPNNIFDTHDKHILSVSGKNPVFTLELGKGVDFPFFSLVAMCLIDRYMIPRSSGSSNANFHAY